MKAVLLITFFSLALASNTRASEPNLRGCPSYLPETVVRAELTDIKTEVSGKWAFRNGIFRITNLSAGPVILEGYRKDGVFEVEEPDIWEMIQVNGGWQGTNGIPGSFMAPPDRLVIPPHGSGEFETSIEPSLPTWEPMTKFYLIVHATEPKACLISAGFELRPQAILEHMAVDAAGKVDAEICPGKAFDHDVVVKFVKKQKFDFGPYADYGPEDLGIMELENHRQIPITLHGERHGDYFYIPESRVLIQQHLKGGTWKTGSPFTPATVRNPLDTLTVPAGGKATFVAEVNPGALYSGWDDRTDRAVLDDSEAKVCAASQGIYEVPDPNCNCSGSKH